MDNLDRNYNDDRFLSLKMAGLMIGGIVLLLLILVLVMMLSRTNDKKDPVDPEPYRKALRAELQNNYGLSEGDYTVTNESYSLGTQGPPERSLNIFFFRFAVAGTEYTAELYRQNDNVMCTDYCVKEFLEIAGTALTERLKALDPAGGDSFKITSLQCDSAKRDAERRTDAANMLPAWVNKAELELFRSGAAYVEGWQRDVNVTCEVEVTSGDMPRLTKSMLSQLKDDLFFVSKMKITCGDVTYTYFPKDDRLETEE